MALTLRRVHTELDVVAGLSSAQEFARQPGLAMMLDLLGACHVMLRWRRRADGKCPQLTVQRMHKHTTPLG